MKESTALIKLKKLEDLFPEEEKDSWISVKWEKQPFLKWIKAKITIKIDNN